MSTWTIVGIVAITFFAMEFVAWATHKYVMHGFLWSLHSDHHKKDHYGFLERNDTFFLIFAVPSMLLFMVGAGLGLHTPWLWIGLGILIYGLAYFFVHEVFIHQRIKWLRNTNNSYFLAIRRAHKVHHKHLGKEDGECFGMLLVPLKYYREVLRSRRAESTT
ncbi:MAG: sterol desaturase family protein [Flavobacteriales bacterium]|nr:sterol desaturase family protein [Flavobacteriales bacterium]MBK9288191.1 sterol desaturase family protein [Flavobacteriales bacterium]MBL0036831.1 sterol desaturase family protein [Flavobacteriales bacterium]